MPPTFLYKPADAKAFWIIDGQQRIRSLVDYQKGLFGEVKFRLKGVDPRWNNKTFDDLSEEEQFSLETTVLRSVVIQQTHPADHTSIYQIFERLNTGGVRLSPMEVRQCVYSSDFLKKLNSFNKNVNWRQIIGLTNVDKRLKDRELLLRIVALYRDVASYEKPMKRFLNKCAVDFQEGLRKSKNTTIYEIDEIEKRFTNSCLEITRELGERPFHLKGRLNFGALDAVMATVMRSGPIDSFNAKYNKLLADDTFQSDVSFNTSDESVLKRRFETAAKYLA